MHFNATIIPSLLGFGLLGWGLEEYLRHHKFRFAQAKLEHAISFTEQQLDDWVRNYNIEPNDKDLIYVYHSNLYPSHLTTNTVALNDIYSDSTCTHLSLVGRVKIMRLVGIEIQLGTGQIIEQDSLRYSKNTALLKLLHEPLPEFITYASQCSHDFRYDLNILGLLLLKDPSQFWNNMFIPTDAKTSRVCQLASKACTAKGYLLGVPDEHLTDQMLDFHLDTCPDAIQWLQCEAKKTRERCLKLIERANPSKEDIHRARLSISIAEHLPDALLNDQSFWDDAFDRNRAYFWRFPDNMKTPAMCLAIVQSDPWKLQLVPPNKRTLGLYFVAGDAEPLIYDQLPKYRWTTRMQYNFFITHTASLSKIMNPTETMLLKIIRSIRHFVLKCRTNKEELTAENCEALLTPYTEPHTVRFSLVISEAQKALTLCRPQHQLNTSE